MPLPGGYLLDTNIIVALVRGNALGQYLDKTYTLSKGANAFVVSIVSIGEMYALAGKFSWGAKKRAILTGLLENFTVIDINDLTLLERYGEIDTYSDANGRPMGKNDAWIAA